MIHTAPMPPLSHDGSPESIVKLIQRTNASPVRIKVGRRITMAEACDIAMDVYRKAEAARKAEREREAAEFLHWESLEEKTSGT